MTSTLTGLEFYWSRQEPKLLIAIVVRASAKPREGEHCFPVDAQNSFQLGVSSYPKGGVIKTHRHLPQERHLKDTQEFIVIQRGSAKIKLIDTDNKEFSSTVLNKGDCIMFLAGGHGFEMFEPVTLVEVKQGPYDIKTDKVILS